MHVAVESILLVKVAGMTGKILPLQLLMLLMQSSAVNDQQQNASDGNTEMPIVALLPVVTTLPAVATLPMVTWLPVSPIIPTLPRPVVAVVHIGLVA